MRRVLRGLSAAEWRATTVLAVRKGPQLVFASDGQVTAGSMVVKDNAQKVKLLRPTILCGFAGRASCSLALMEELDKLIEKYNGFPLLRPCVEFSKKWRGERMYRSLEATVLVADMTSLVEVDGDGNVIVHERMRAIGSGGPFAECAAEAFFENDELSAEQIVRKSMAIAARKCIYTNSNLTVQVVDFSQAPPAAVPAQLPQIEQPEAKAEH